MDNEVDIPKRISLSDMDTSKYMTFGSLFILAVDTALFPLDTLKTIVMSDRGKKLKETTNNHSFNATNHASSAAAAGNLNHGNYLKHSITTTAGTVSPSIGASSNHLTGTQTSPTSNISSDQTKPSRIPLDSNQSNRPPKQKSILRLAVSIAKKEGLMRFWRGISISSTSCLIIFRYLSFG